MSEKSRKNKLRREQLALDSENPEIQGHAYNHRRSVEQQIMTPLKGNRAVEIAIKEIINNCFDAEANQVRLMFSVYLGQVALVIMDDGHGLTRSGANSMLSFARSAQGRRNKKSGKNGTGTKLILGLGKLSKTKVTVFSFSETFTGGLHLEYDFEYLVALAEGKTSQGYMVEGCNYKQFYHEKVWERKPGTTFIFTGFDPEILNIKSLIASLGEALTPRTQSKVFVYTDSKFQTIELAKITGKKYTIDTDEDHLGNIELDVYYDGSNDGPKICGRLNYICDYMSLYKELSQKQKSRIPRIWQSIGGFIYIENLNEYREHDNSLNQDFFKDEISEELVKLLELVGQELVEKQEKNDNEKEIQQQREMIKKIVEASRKIHTPPYQPGKSYAVTAGPLANDEVYIVPRFLTLQKGQIEKVTLINKGHKFINLKSAKWLTNNLVDISGSGESVVLTAKNIGQLDIPVTGEGWSHTLNVKVVAPSDAPYIKGSKYVKLGEVVDYEIVGFKGSVKWALDKNDSDILLLKNEGYTTSIQVNQNTKTEYFALKCLDENNTIIAEKRLIVSDRKSGRASVVHIGEKSYLLEFATHYQNCASQIETDGNDYPIILINPLHPIIRNKKGAIGLNEIITAMCSAAIFHQTESDGLSTQKALNLLWKSIETYNRLILG